MRSPRRTSRRTFFESIEKFDENLEILLSFVSVPYFTPESVQKEQGIIGQEIRMTEDEPDYAVYYGLMKALYKHNPLRDSVAGTVESIAQITDKTLYDCHNVFYNPSNMALCVAGDVEPEAIVAAARKLLPKEPGEVPQRDYGPPETLIPEDEARRTEDGGQHPDLPRRRQGDAGKGRPRVFPSGAGGQPGAGASGRPLLSPLPEAVR